MLRYLLSFVFVLLGKQLTQLIAVRFKFITKAANIN